MRRLARAAMALTLVSVACTGASPSVPSPTATTDTVTTSSASSPPSPPPSSPSPTQQPSPDVSLPEDAPVVVDDPAEVARVDAGETALLVPPGAEIASTSVLSRPEDVVDQVAVVWRRGADAFASEIGLVIWQRAEEPPAWRAVYAFTDRPRKGVLGVDARSGDLTADAIPDVLSFEQVGGTGACGTFRVIVSGVGFASEILREDRCDTRISISRGDLRVEEAVYEPDDPHCCPSAFRVSILHWTGMRWKEVSSELSRA